MQYPVGLAEIRVLIRLLQLAIERLEQFQINLRSDHFSNCVFIDVGYSDQSGDSFHFQIRLEKISHLANERGFARLASKSH